jgi:predicted enzyme involved in methoxymalonyl-ACP biosynthesis
VRIEQGFAYIDTALMSCRVMGRMIERAAMAVIENYIFNMGIQFIEGEYVPTSKNGPVKDFFEKLGYERYKVLDNGDVLYRKSLKGIIPIPNCLQVLTK